MTHFRVWAPNAETLDLLIDGDRHRMSPRADGWWERDLPQCGDGTDYSFLINNREPALPDPRTAWQPEGVHGPSRVVDHGAFPWTDDTWRGLPLKGSVVYELHIGTFTAEGTFDAATERLDHLVALGVDAVELLPVNAFSGDHGWGYDGVDLYAVQHSYGGPAGLKRFVDACHSRGLAVVLDVVYNHLGPAGNYLSRFAPYFTVSHVTPWGPAVNLDSEHSDEVRRFLVDNALMWLRDYHIDGLRLDAVHELLDLRATHVLEELVVAVDALAAQVRKPLFLIAESDLNDPKLVRGREAGGFGLDAQWSDDFHHCLHATLTGERSGYYVDFGELATLAKCLTSVFVHNGTWSTFRERTHGRPVDTAVIPGHRFLGYLQDHDQVGNRAQGDRSSHLMSDGLLRIGAALVFTSPFTPMLWMGEEWGARTPWQFFTDHDDPDLAAAVRNGRREEFESHGWGPEEVPDPQARSTFERSKLDWSELDKDTHSSLLEWHRRLIALRRSLLELSDGRVDLVRCSYDEQARWFVMRRGTTAVICNLSPDRQAVPVDGTPIEVLLASAPGFVYRTGSVETDGESVVIATVA